MSSRGRTRVQPAARAGPSAAANPPAAPRSSPLAELRDAVPALNAVAAHLMGLPTAAAVPSSDELGAAEGLLHRYGNSTNAAGLRMLLLYKPLQAALLQLAAAAANTPVEDSWAVETCSGSTPAVSQRWGDKFALQAVDVLHTACVVSLGDPAALWGPTHDIAQHLLRMRVLHLAARQAAGTVAALRSGLLHIPPSAATDNAWPWMAVAMLVAILSRPATLPSAKLAACGADACTRQVQLRLELAQALASSRVLDHVAQGLVALALHPGYAPAAQLAALQHAVSYLQMVMLRVSDACRSEPAGSAARPAALVLQSAMSTPGVLHLHTAVGLAALHAADGGPVHGLDIRPYARLALPYGGIVSHHTERSGVPLQFSVNKHTERNFRALARAVGAAAATAQLRPSRAAGLLLRAGRASVQCMGMPCAAPARGSAEGAAGPAPSPLAPLPCASSARYCLEVLAGVLLRCRGVRAGQWSGAWGLVLAYLDGLLGTQDVQQLQSSSCTEVLLEYCAFLQPGYAGCTPLEHERRLQAAADGGLLPWLERLLRGAARSDPATVTPHAALASALPTNLPYARLALFAQSTQAASLVVSMRKQLLSAWATHSSSALFYGALPVRSILADLASILMVHPTPQQPPALSPSNPPRPPGGRARGQLQPHEGGRLDAPHVVAASPLLLSLVLHELLPALAGWLRATEPRAVELVLAADRQACYNLCAVWDMVLVWVTNLCMHVRVASTAVTGTCGGGGVGGSGAGGGRGVAGASMAAAGGAAGGGGGRAVGCLNAAAMEELLQRLDVVGLVGAGLRCMLQLLRASKRIAGGAPPLVHPTVQFDDWLEAAVTVRRTRPHEVRRAAQAVGAEAEAASAAAARDGSSASGARGGGGSSGAALPWPIAELLAEAPPDASYATTLTLLSRGGDGGMSREQHLVETLVTKLPLDFLVPYDEARALLRSCSNPGCAELKGDSEAGLEAGLLRCGGCGAAWYCCKGCQGAHWRAGHKGACAGKAAFAAGSNR